MGEGQCHPVGEKEGMVRRLHEADHELDLDR